MKLFLTALAMTIALSATGHAESTKDTMGKIGFDLDQLDEFGLYGPAEGKRSLSYEFCVPNDFQTSELVQAIDPTLVIYLHSPGRAGCGEFEVLAIGETHQPNYREVLLTLARLDVVERIEQFWAE